MIFYFSTSLEDHLSPVKMQSRPISCPGLMRQYKLRYNKLKSINHIPDKIKLTLFQELDMLEESLMISDNKNPKKYRIEEEDIKDNY